MEDIKAKVSSHLETAIDTIDGDLLDVVDRMVLEEKNLEELVRPEAEDTRSHLRQLKGLVDGLREEIVGLRGDLAAAQGLIAGADVAPGTEEESDAEKAPTSGEGDLSPQEAAAQRHDEPVTLGGILRSLIMANEPAQRKKAARS